MLLSQTPRYVCHYESCVLLLGWTFCEHRSIFAEEFLHYLLAREVAMDTSRRQDVMQPSGNVLDLTTLFFRLRGKNKVPIEEKVWLRILLLQLQVRCQ